MKKIFLTVDVECHDYNLQNQYIWGKIGKEEYGLKKILDLGREFNIPINFFIDFAECNRYGENFILKIIKIINEYKQGVYLHIHPNYLSNDDTRTFLWQYNYEEQLEVLDKGIKLYKKLLSVDNCPAFRAGRYSANIDMYKALYNLGIKTIDLSYCYDLPKMCKLDYNQIKSLNKPTSLYNQTVLPNTRYIGFNFFNKTKAFNLDSSETTLYEYKQILKKNKLDNIVCTMHSWHFIKKYFFDKKNIYKNDHEIKNFKKMVALANKYGYTFCDLSRDFIFTENEYDEIIDISKKLKDKFFSLISNFLRFKKISRLNKKYFTVYTLFYFFCIGLLCFLVYLGIG